MQKPAAERRQPIARGESPWKKRDFVRAAERRKSLDLAPTPLSPLRGLDQFGAPSGAFAPGYWLSPLGGWSNGIIADSHVGGLRASCAPRRRTARGPP